MSKQPTQDLVKFIGLPLLALAVAWGTIQTITGVTEGRVDKLETWRDEWIARVLPLDATQDAQIHDNTRRIERIEDKID